MRWIWLAVWLGICLCVGGVSGRWTAGEIPGWYRTLVRPSIAPPNWVFGPVWTTLYVLMAIAAWGVTQEAASTERTLAVALFLLQLSLNFAWSWIFFRKHALGAALVEVVFLWITIGATTIVFGRLSSWTGWLLVPYLVWVGFASFLNEEFWRLN
jgi:tryptophan-rich sensory protein